jgi:hypothetical protein
MNRLLFFRLARLLYAPAGHTRLFRLAHNPPPMPTLRLPFRPLLELLALLFICGLMLSPAIILLLGAGIAAILFNGTLFGAWWGNQIAAHLSDLRGRGVYDQYAMLPGGRLSLHLSIGTGVLHRLESLSNLHRVIRATTVVFSGFTVFTICIIVLNMQRGQAMTDLIGAIQTSFDTSLGLLMVLLLFYLDHLASITLAALCGMIVPMWTSRGTEARLWLIGLFLSVQVASYAVWALLALGLLPLLFPVALNGFSRLPFLLLQLLLYIAVREVIIRLVWQVFCGELDLAAQESDSTF